MIYHNNFEVFVINLILIVFVLNFIILFIIPARFIEIIRWCSIIASILLLFLVILLLWAHYNMNFWSNTTYYDLFMFYDWAKFFNISYIIGFDGLSLIFLFLIAILIVLSILIAWNTIINMVKEFFLFLFMLEFFLFNVFLVSDLFFFYIFFESVLLPMFFIIGIWGTRKRKTHASYLLFFFTMAGSFFMLAAILILYSNLGIVDLRYFYHIDLSFSRELFIWFCLFLAFAVKVPIYPMHIWLPEVHAEAPTVGSVLLAGVLLKLGTYGMLRFLVPVFPDSTEFFLPLITILCVIGNIYTCLITMIQVDLKKLVAYSSVGHMSFVVLGLFSFSSIGIIGSIVLMISHGFVSGGLFCRVGFLYDRHETRLLRDYGGICQVMPVYSLFLLFFILANMSFPLTSSFVGEFFILLGVADMTLFALTFMVFSTILSAIYSIWVYNRLVFGDLKLAIQEKFSDISFKEFYILGLLCLFIFFLAIYPKAIFGYLEKCVYLILTYKYVN